MARQRSDKAVPAPASARKGATGGLPASAGETKRETTTARTGSATKKKTTKPTDSNPRVSPTRTASGSGTSAAGSTAKGKKSAQTGARPTRATKSPRVAARGFPRRTSRKPIPASAVTAGLEPTFEQIRQRAYEIHLGRGGASG